mmetsp:Transcript_25875/g.32563  ORF Transcript_25875/g.32563 Transcript_25875/m.32563 type:complete len:171 (+) Transcript_25875:181-693(+)
MDETDMLKNAVAIAHAAREKGIKIIHAPIHFSSDGNDNPNKGLGILAGCYNDKLFTLNTWNSEFAPAMKPKQGDIIVNNKRGLDAFPGTDLEQILIDNNIETICLAGFLTNCCVESTMRTAYEKGFNVITLIDCCATTSTDGQKAATHGTFNMFSRPLTSTELLSELNKK